MVPATVVFRAASHMSGAAEKYVHRQKNYLILAVRMTKTVELGETPMSSADPRKDK
jgi:hypothetical protein